jgi:hypothetical protein
MLGAMRLTFFRVALPLLLLGLICRVDITAPHISQAIARLKRNVVVRVDPPTPEPVRVLFTFIDRQDRPVSNLSVVLGAATAITDDAGDVRLLVPPGHHDLDLGTGWMVAWDQPQEFAFYADVEQTLRVHPLCSGPTFVREADGTAPPPSKVSWWSSDSIIHLVDTDADGLVVGLPYRACGALRILMMDTGNAIDFRADSNEPVYVTLPGIGEATAIVTGGFDDPFVDCSHAESVTPTDHGVYNVVAYGLVTDCTVGATGASSQRVRVPLDGESHTFALEETRTVAVYTEPPRSDLQIECGIDLCLAESDHYVCDCPLVEAFVDLPRFGASPVPDDVDSIRIDVSETKGAVLGFWEGALPCSALIEFRTGSIEAPCESDGRIEFGKEVASGAATLTVKAIGEQGRREVDVPPDGTAVVGRVFPDEGSASGRIVTDLGLEDAELVATRGRASLDEKTGHFELSRLPPGVVRLWLRVPGRKPQLFEAEPGEKDIVWRVD